jgi:hypothetical protein
LSCCRTSRPRWTRPAWHPPAAQQTQSSSGEHLSYLQSTYASECSRATAPSIWPAPAAGLPLD